MRTPLPLLSPTSSSQQQQHNYAAAALCLLWERVRPTIASGGAAAGGAAAGGVQGGGVQVAGVRVRAPPRAVALAGAMVVHGGWSDVSGEAEALHHGVLADTHVLRPAAADAAARVLGAAAATEAGARLGMVAARGDGARATPLAPHRCPHLAGMCSWRAAGTGSTARRTCCCCTRRSGDGRRCRRRRAAARLPAHACVPLPGAGDAFLLVGRAAGNDGTSWTDRWELRLEVEGDGAGGSGRRRATRGRALDAETRAGSRLEARRGTVVLRPGRLLVLGVGAPRWSRGSSCQTAASRRRRAR